MDQQQATKAEKINNQAINDVLKPQEKSKDEIIGLRKRVDLKQLGRGTYGVVHPVDFVHKNGKYSQGALKTMNRSDDISGFGNLPEIELLIKFGGNTFVPEVIIIDIAPYYFKRRNGTAHDEFLSVGSKRAYCDAATLSKRGGYTMEHVLKMSAEILSAIKYMHGRNVCHRDIKPGNILIYMENGIPTANITDFGFACHFTKTTPRSPNVNTVWYRSPEIVWRIPNYKSNSDIWSIGCTIYEIATGTILFEEVKDGENTKIFFENQLKLIPNEWTPETQKIFRDNSEFSGLKIFDNSSIRHIEPSRRSFMRQFRLLHKYKTSDEPLWQAIDKILLYCFDFNYKTRLNAANILSNSAFNSQRLYIDNISKQQDRTQTNDEINIKIKQETNAKKCEFFETAYRKFVIETRYMSPRGMFHAVDLANIFLTKYKDTSMDLNNLFSCCIYFFNKTFAISVCPTRPEKFFWRTFTEAEVNTNEEKLKELDKLIFDFESIIIDKDKMVGFKTYRPNLFEMQDYYTHVLDNSKLHTLFKEFVLISDWKEKSFRYMYRFLYNKLFDSNFKINQ